RFGSGNLGRVLVERAAAAAILCVRETRARGNGEGSTRHAGCTGGGHGYHAHDIEGPGGDPADAPRGGRAHAPAPRAIRESTDPSRWRLAALDGRADRRRSPLLHSLRLLWHHPRPPAVRGGLALDHGARCPVFGVVRERV